MNGLWIGILGTAGTALSTFSLLPQVLHTWRRGSAIDISAAWLVLALASMAIWVIYGSLIEAAAVVWTNVLCFVQCGIILVFKLKTRRTAVTQT